MDDILEGKSDEEIKRAATYWFTAQEAFVRGERVPLSVFALSTKGLTAGDVQWVLRQDKLMRDHQEIKRRLERLERVF